MQMRALAILALSGLLQARNAGGPATREARVAPVPFERILHAGTAEPQNWLTYSGNYASQRYSNLSQITPDNARDPVSASPTGSSCAARRSGTPRTGSGEEIEHNPPRCYRIFTSLS